MLSAPGGGWSTNVLSWLNSKNEHFVDPKQDLMDFAAKGGHIDTLDWLNKHKPHSFSTKLLLMATLKSPQKTKDRFKQKIVVKWVLEHKDRHFTGPIYWRIYEMAKNVSPETLEFILSKRPDWLEYFCDAIIILHKSELFKKIYEFYGENNDIWPRIFCFMAERLCPKGMLKFLYTKEFIGSYYDVHEVYSVYQNECEKVFENTGKQMTTKQKNALDYLSSIYIHEKNKYVL